MRSGQVLISRLTKAPNTDAGQAANQDRVTSNVAITRGTSGGQIFNAVSESMPQKL